MRIGRSATAALAVLALGAMSATGALAESARFSPLPASTACGAPVDDPFQLPDGYTQSIVAQEGDGGTIDLWDMNTQNENGKDAGRYVFRAHEVGGNGMVSMTDLKTGQTKPLAQRPDWERLDGIVWSPWGTIITAEETNSAATKDPAVPEATAGLAYELFVDPNDPTKLRTDDPRDDVAPFDDGIAARPNFGSRSNEGLRFDHRGNLYGISEVDGGSIFRYTPDRKGDLRTGKLEALKTPNGHTGEGTWIEIPQSEARVNSQAAAAARGANGYNRPEDVETDESTGKDANNGAQTLYVAVTGTDEVVAVDLQQKDRPFAYQYVVGDGTNFDFPDNLALDRDGNLAITEDPPSNPVGADIWVAAPPRGEDRDRGGQHQPAAAVQRFASLRDCAAEPTGIYFASAATDRWRSGTGDSLLVNRQHAGGGTTRDQLVAIDPDR